MNLPHERRVEIQDWTGIVTRALLRRYEETQEEQLLNIAAGIGENSDKLCQGDASNEFEEFVKEFTAVL